MTLNFTALWDALGWAILHSLWQAALIGIIVWAVRALTTERQAKFRYLAGMTGLVATFAAFLVTFVILTFDRLGEISPIAFDRLGEGGETASANLDFSVSVLPIQTLQADLATALVPWLGIVWAVGFAFLSLQAYRAWTVTKMMSTQGLHSVGAEWTDRFEALLTRSRTSSRVRLFISDHVGSPITLGTLKPLVLVPAGFLTAMPSAQVEAILLHELAHIRRHDFLFGLVQTAIRTVLYFNPTVLLLSRLVDADREQACDDMAVQVCGRPSDLARGLAALRLGSQSPALAMAADGGPLLGRLNRLMGRPVGRQASNRLSAAAVSALMIGTAACGTVSMAHPHPGDEPEAPEFLVPDTVVTPGAKPVVAVVMPEIPEIPAMPTMPATPVIPPVPNMPPIVFSDFDNEAEFEAAMEAWGEKMEAWGEDVGERFDDEWEASMEAWGEQMEVWGEQVEALSEAYGAFEDLSDEELRDMGISHEWLDAHLEALAHQIEIQTGKNHIHADRLAAQVERQQARVQRDVERAQRQAEKQVREVERHARAMERKARHAERTSKNANAQKIRKAVTKKLLAEGLIQSADDKIVFELKGNDRLRVNGKSQPADMADCFRATLTEHGVDPDAKVKMKFNGDNTSVWINSEDTNIHIEDKK